MLAPIILFVYCRINHTTQVIESLLLNSEARNSDLIIYSDAARNPKLTLEVENLREYLRTIKGFKSITIHERSSNLGLFSSIINGVTEVLSAYGKAIVLEDDIVVSPYFLEYMNIALEKYQPHPEVASIHGYVYPVKELLPDSFFINGADCWGWGTWKRAWDKLNLDGNFLYEELYRLNKINKFDFNGSYKFSKMLKDKNNNKNNSWAILWYASAFLQDMVTLYPGKSLVMNIGNDGSGTHSEVSDFFDVSLAKNRISTFPINTKPSREANLILESFFRKSRPTLARRIIKRLLTLCALNKF